MEPNESILSSYYPQQQHHHRPPPTITTTTPTSTNTTTASTPSSTTPAHTPITTSANTNGIFSTNPPNHHHHHQPHYSSSEATPLLFSPHSVTGRAPVAAAVPTETVKRKRGRPRKYGTPDSQTSVSPSVKRVSSPLHSPPHKKEFSSIVSSSKKAQLAALGNAGQGFTPHIINLAAGEDVGQKIMSFVQQRKCAVCIISASGSISNASLRQPAMLGGNVSYEGRFEILSLSGSFIHTEIGGGASSRSGGLSVCLAGTDGRIVGGGVGGPLLAAGPVQVIIGSFFIDTTKDADKKVEASSSKLPPQVVGASVTSVSFRPAPDSSGRVPMRGNEDHQNIGGNFMAQSRGMHIPSPRSNDWRGVLDGRNSGNFEFTERMDGGASPEDGDDEQLGV